MKFIIKLQTDPKVLLKYVSAKDKKAFATDLKKIYHTTSEEQGYKILQYISEKWHEQYPYAMKSWEVN